MAETFVWVVAASLLLLLLELVMGRHKGVYQPGDFKILFGSLFLGRGMMAFVSAFLVATIWGALLPATSKDLFVDQPLWLLFITLLLVDEFCFYWAHRWAHEGMGTKKPGLRWLWKIHRTHHSGKHMNVLLNYRLNLSWYFIIPSAWVGGAALHLGFAEVFVIHIFIKQMWNLITHSNFRWDDAIRRQPVAGKLFRALEHVVVSPGIHHTHHGYGKDGASYKNFGVVLSLYDWFFGSLHIPEGRPAHYGLPGANAHWLEELLYPLVQINKQKQISGVEQSA